MLLVITLNVNGLNPSIKRQFSRMDKKIRFNICYLNFRGKDMHKMKMKAQRKMFHANSNQKRVRWLCEY